VTARVLILGGYGNFGSYIARALAPDPAVQLIIAGRNAEKARSIAGTLSATNPAEGVALDISGDFGAALAALKPAMVIHTVGPFQNQDYRVAQACVAAAAHYVDLADARAFVCGIGAIDEAARAKGVAVIAGASSVPCLTAAYLDDALRDFAVIESVDYGITAAQQTNRGLSTASAILSYVGRPFTMLCGGSMQRVHGWQGMHCVTYPELGRRWFGYCDIPDLDLFPARYPGLEDMRFAAGHEIALLHFGTWLLSWGVRLRLLPRLDRWGGFLLRTSFLFDRLGSGCSGFHMHIRGKGADGQVLDRREWIVARSGDGPNIPCMPAILLARRLARGEELPPGARPCVGLIGLAEYLGALEDLDITIGRQ
jgi:hypothetical protein